jgi:hypothetical protein
MARFLSLISRERLGPPPAVTLNLMCWPVPELPHKAGKINFCPPHSHQLLRPHLHLLSLLPRTQSPRILYLARPSLIHALPSSLCDCPLPKYYPQSHLPFVAQRSSHIWTLNDFPAQYSCHIDPRILGSDRYTLERTFLNTPTTWLAISLSFKMPRKSQISFFLKIQHHSSRFSNTALFFLQFPRNTILEHPKQWSPWMSSTCTLRTSFPRTL